MSTSVSTQGPLARLIQPLVDSSVFDFWAGHINPAWSWSRALARVVERRVEAHDAVTLVLKPNRHVGGFVAGQHVNVGVEVNGRRVTRSYSLSNAPRRDGRLEITIKHVPGGVVSTHLCQHLKVGDVLTGFIRRAELARDKADQRPDRFAVGEKVDANGCSASQLDADGDGVPNASDRCPNTPRGEAVWLSARDDDKVVVYDTSTFAEIAKLAVDKPSGIFFTARGQRVGL